MSQLQIEVEEQTRLKFFTDERQQTLRWTGGPGPLRASSAAAGRLAKRRQGVKDQTPCESKVYQRSLSVWR
jgi:hypothetical protein